MNYYLRIIFFIGIYNVGLAQQDFQYGHYMFNPQLINPAVSGTKDVMSLNMGYRNQWTNFSGAPKTIVATLHSPFKNENAGWGIGMLGESIGPKQVFNLGFSFAYKIKIGSTTKLSFGLRSGINSFSYRADLIKLYDAEDNLISGNINRVSPNLDAGAYFYSNKYYVGAGVNHIAGNALDVSSKGGRLMVLEPHYYLTAGYANAISNNFVINPSMLIKKSSGNALSVDFNCNVHCYDLFWLGTSYRLNNSISFLANIQISKTIRFGYVFDWQTSAVRTYTSNSHELFLGFDFIKNRKQIFNSRYL